MEVILSGLFAEINSLPNNVSKASKKSIPNDSERNMVRLKLSRLISHRLTAVFKMKSLCLAQNRLSESGVRAGWGPTGGQPNHILSLFTEA